MGYVAEEVGAEEVLELLEEVAEELVQMEPQVPLIPAQEVVVRRGPGRLASPGVLAAAVEFVSGGLNKE